MKIEYYLSTEYFKTRKQLEIETGLNDRTIRKKISTLKKEKAVLFNSHTRGYRLAKNIEDIETLDEAKKEMNLIQHSINDIEARKRDMNMSERTYIAYLYKLKDKIMLLENMNHIPTI